MSSDLNAAWNLIEKNLKGQPGSREYRDSWALERERFYDVYKCIPTPQEDLDKLATLKDSFKGKRIFVVGNGPSLNKMPLELLKNEFTFCSNRFYLIYPKISWRPTFYTVVDWRVGSDVADEIMGLSGVTKFYPERFRGLLDDDNDVYWYHHCTATGEQARFATDATGGIRGAGSVTGSAIQLAFHMGFDPIYLIGCDANYTIPDTVLDSGDDKFGSGIGFRLESTADDDPNHFDPSYFGKGRKWHDPNVPRMIQGYEQCKFGISRAGRRIFNSTVGGKLEVFERVDFLSLFPSGDLYRKSDSNQFTFEEKATSESSGFILPEINEFLVGPFERESKVQVDESEIILHLSETQGTMVDVGAHHGNSSIPFAENGWNVVSCEPDPDNREILQRRIKQDWNYQVFSCAISDREESEVAFFGSEVSSGVSGLSPFLDSHKEKATVSVHTLSSFLCRNKIPEINFLKVDTEGFDFMVLKGNNWKKFHPEFIVCEFDEKKTIPLGYTYTDVCQFLVDQGYLLYISEWHPIERYGMKHSWKGLKQWPCKISDEDAWGNILAFRQPISTTNLSSVTCLLSMENAEGLRSKMGLPASLKEVSAEAKRIERLKNKRIHGLLQDVEKLNAEKEEMLKELKAIQDSKES